MYFWKYACSLVCILICAFTFSGLIWLFYACKVCGRSSLDLSHVFFKCLLFFVVSSSLRLLRTGGRRLVVWFLSRRRSSMFFRSSDLALFWQPPHMPNDQRLAWGLLRPRRLKRVCYWFYFLLLRFVYMLLTIVHNTSFQLFFLVLHLLLLLLGVATSFASAVLGKKPSAFLLVLRCVTSTF